ncbi:MAG TPA: prolyl oligopeptidase family serine peptidase [Blastocatellia bacterium]|nr:prolyl oligopeptidase family serine peptidase [Blastocatellia bacterium]
MTLRRGHPRMKLAGILIALLVGVLFALSTSSRGQSETETFTIDGKERHAVVFARSTPIAGRGAPVVFVFHGHGGNAQNAARRFRVHELWPEAVVVYMQGEPGVQGITDPEGKLNGWQKNPGELGDRDIKFFDAALERIQKKYVTDPNRMYVLGHSNGGRFVNLRWNMRGDKIAALCSAAGPGGRLIETAKPKPVFIIAGEKDPLVPFQAQQSSIELARKVLKTDASKAKVDGLLRAEPGVNHTELVTYIHPGGHMFPEQALPAIVSFFKRHTSQS